MLLRENYGRCPLIATLDFPITTETGPMPPILSRLYKGRPAWVTQHINWNFP